jgi:hypothetical protein
VKSPRSIIIRKNAVDRARGALHSISALEEFFAAYGRRPAWPGRHEAMVSRCRQMLGICQRWEPGGGAVRRWQQRIQITRSWAEGQP